MDSAREKVVDEMLVLRCQRGCRPSFELLMRRWQRPLWRYARRLTGDSDDAWDVMQESWIVILTGIRRLRDPAWFAAWAHRIVRNKCADHIRDALRRRRLNGAAGTRPTPEGRSDPDDRSAALAEVVGDLTPTQRELLALRYGAGLNILEIAMVLDLPAGTVKRRLHETRQQLKNALEGAER